MATSGSSVCHGSSISNAHSDMELAEMLQLLEVLELSEESAALGPSSEEASSFFDAEDGAASEEEDLLLARGLEWPSPFEGDVMDDVGVECGICQDTQPLGSVLFLPCSHCFCLQCLSKHAQVQIAMRHVPIPCPAESCAVPLPLEECEKFVDPEHLSKALLLLAEQSIPDSERFFCPFRECSALMVLEAGEGQGRAACAACRRHVCTSCTVPWHDGVTCEQYKATPEAERDPNDFKLKQLAQEQQWQRCPCGFIVERNGGCRHMTCPECKAEFCYKCGRAYSNSKAVCDCHLGG